MSLSLSLLLGNGCKFYFNIHSWAWEKPKRLIRFDDDLWDKTKINFLSLGKKLIYSATIEHTTFLRLISEENCHNFLSPPSNPKFVSKFSTNPILPFQKSRNVEWNFSLKARKNLLPTLHYCCAYFPPFHFGALIDLSWYLRSFWNMRMSWNF